MKDNPKYFRTYTIKTTKQYKAKIIPKIMSLPHPKNKNDDEQERLNNAEFLEGFKKSLKYYGLNDFSEKIPDISQLLNIPSEIRSEGLPMIITNYSTPPENKTPRGLQTLPNIYAKSKFNPNNININPENLGKVYGHALRDLNYLIQRSQDYQNNPTEIEKLYRKRLMQNVFTSFDLIKAKGFNTPLYLSSLNNNQTFKNEEERFYQTKKEYKENEIIPTKPEFKEKYEKIPSLKMQLELSNN